MVVGLGNPGRRYRVTRHNAGFMVAEELLNRARAGADRTQGGALVAPVRLGDEEVIIVQPQTYMNLSGSAVAGVAGRRGIEPSQIVVIHDDADLVLGRIRIRRGGSPAGHKGVQSIVDSFGTQEIPRLRVGIGKDEQDLSERVLQRFTKAELGVVEQVIEQAADAVEMMVTVGIAEAMNEYNRRERPAR